MKKIFDYYYKNYDKITILAFTALFVTSLISIVFQPLAYLVGGIIYLLMLIAFCNLIVCYKDMMKLFESLEKIFEKMKM